MRANFSDVFVAKLRSEASCSECRGYQKIIDSGGDALENILSADLEEFQRDVFDIPGVNHLFLCDRMRIRMAHLDRNGMYRDPWMYAVLRHTGPALKDLTVDAYDSITPDIFEYTPNLTALRLIDHQPLIYKLLPVYCCSLITLELVGPCTVPSLIVQHLFKYKYTPLRALAMFNRNLNLNACVTVEKIEILGMY